MKSVKSLKKSVIRMQVHGFSRGLNAEKILGVTNDPGELYFLIKVCETVSGSFSHKFLLS